MSNQKEPMSDRTEETFARACAVARWLIDEDKETALPVAVVALSMIARHRFNEAQFKRFVAKISELVRKTPPMVSSIFGADRERTH